MPGGAVPPPPGWGGRRPWTLAAPGESPDARSVLDERLGCRIPGQTLGVAAPTHLVLRLESDDEILVLGSKVVTGEAFDVPIEERNARIDGRSEELSAPVHPHTERMAGVGFEARSNREENGKVRG